MTVPITPVPTSLGDGVKKVVSLGSEEQMIGSDARRIVAMVQNAQTRGDRPVVNFPRGTVRALASEQPVAVSVGSRRPCPALPLGAVPCGFANSAPKANNRIQCLSRQFTISPRRAPTRAIDLSSPMSAKQSPASYAYTVASFCFKMIVGHGVTSKIGCKVSRLACGLTTTCGPFLF